MTEEVRDIDPVAPAAPVEGVPAETKTETPAQATPETPEAEPETPEASTDTASDDETAGDNAEPSAEDGDETDGKPKKLSRHQRERRAKIRALERAERAEQEAAELRRLVAERGDKASEPSGGFDPEPRMDEYQQTIDPAGFHKLAHDAWKIRQAERQARQDSVKGESERKQALAFRELVQAHEDREDEARERMPDYDDTIRKSRTDVSPQVGRLILESDKSALLAYHLAKNEDTLRELNAMSERQATREIGRLEARLSLPQAKKTTTAPAPIKPPSGGGASPPTDIRKLADSEDITAYARARDKK